MTTPEFFTTGAPSSALSVKIDHFLDYKPVEDAFGQMIKLSTLNKASVLITDPIGESDDSEKRVDAMAKEANDAMGAFTTKTDIWGNNSVAFMIRQWRTAFIDALVIARVLKATNNDYKKFSVDNMRDLCICEAGLVSTDLNHLRDDMDKILRNYLDTCDKLEKVCVPYFKQLSDIYEMLTAFYVDTDPEKKLPSIMSFVPTRVAKYNLDGTTTLDAFYSVAGNTIDNMLSRFAANVDAMSHIDIDNKNYAADMKTALAKVYHSAPVKVGFFRQLISTPLPWLAHKLKAAQIRNAGIFHPASFAVDLAAGTLSINTNEAVSAEMKASFDKVIVDLYTDQSWKDASKALAAQLMYLPVCNRNVNVQAIVCTTGTIFTGWNKYAAANTYDATVTDENFMSAWRLSHSTTQDTATKNLRAWISVAQSFSDAPLEFANHHDETWFTGKIDDFVELSKSQRINMIDLIVSCITRIAPDSALTAMGSSNATRDSKKKGSRSRNNKGKDQPKQD